MLKSVTSWERVVTIFQILSYAVWKDPAVSKAQTEAEQSHFLNQILKPKTRQRPEVGGLQSPYIVNELCMFCTVVEKENLQFKYLLLKKSKRKGNQEEMQSKLE